MKSLTTILANVREDYGLSPMFELYEWLDAKVVRSGIESLTRPGRAIFLVQRYDGDMAQGGYETLITWDRTLGIMPMIAALREVGAPRTAGVLTDLASLFPSGTIPDNAELRWREYRDLVPPRRQRKRMQWALRCAQRAEDVCQLCLEHARHNLVELRAENAELGAAPDCGGGTAS
ncbi:DUF4375 domain-containing protein [bacterium]|nr:DUF4375 domain-containing protein [bacterium]